MDIERFLTKKQIEKILPTNYEDLSNNELTAHLTAQRDIMLV